MKKTRELSYLHFTGFFLFFVFLCPSGRCASSYRSSPPSDAGSAASGRGLIRELASVRPRLFRADAHHIKKKKKTQHRTSSGLFAHQRDYDFLRHEYGDQLPQGAPAERDEVLHVSGKLTAPLQSLSLPPVCASSLRCHLLMLMLLISSFPLCSLLL